MPQVARPCLPARSASLPPIHLSSHQDDPAKDNQAGLASKANEHRGAFLWMCLPEKIQHDILYHAFFPPDLGATALLMGNPSHEAHLKATAIPILLGLGNWQDYNDAARILYSQVHLVLFRYPDAAMHFLTSPTTLRLRNLVCKLQMRMDIEDDLHLFDEGWRSTTSIPEARVNVPTALHSMHIHGRLCEVHFLLNVPEIIYQPESEFDSEIMSKCAVPNYYLPMARLQLAHQDIHFEQPPITNATLAAQPGREVIAPAFLAGRAFQYGFLPLLREGAMWRSDLSLEAVLEDDESQVEDMNAAGMFRCWLGATIVEVLGNRTARGNARNDWVNPFVIRRHVADRNEACMLQRCDEGGAKGSTAMLADDNECGTPGTNHSENEAQHRSTPLPEAPERIGYKSRGDDLVDDSPIRYDTSGTSSDSLSVTSTEDATKDFGMNVQATGIDNEVMELAQTRDEGPVCHAGGSNNDTEVFNPCLETAVSHEAISEGLACVEESPMCGQTSHTLKLYSHGEDDVADANPERGEGVPSKIIGGLDGAKAVVAQNVRAEKPAPISHVLHDRMERSLSPVSGNISSTDKCSRSSEATVKSAETVLCDDTTTIAPFDSHENGGNHSVRKSSTSNLNTFFDNRTLATPSVAEPVGLSKHDSASMNPRRSQDSDSSSGDNSDSDSLSVCEARDHFKTSKIMTQIINSSIATSSSSSDSHDSSDSNEGYKIMANKTAHVQRTLGSSTNQRRGSIASSRKWSPGKEVSSACLRDGDTTLTVNKQATIGRLSSNMSTNPQTPKSLQNSRSATSQQVSHGPRPGEDAPSLKRKTSHEGLEQAKKSKKARWRANRRARLLARTAGEE